MIEMGYGLLLDPPHHSLLIFLWCSHPWAPHHSEVELIKQQEAQSRYEEIKKFVAGTAAASGQKTHPTGWERTNPRAPGW